MKSSVIINRILDSSTLAAGMFIASGLVLLQIRFQEAKVITELLQIFLKKLMNQV